MEEKKKKNCPHSFSVKKKTTALNTIFFVPLHKLETYIEWSKRGHIDPTSTISVRLWSRLSIRLSCLATLGCLLILDEEVQEERDHRHHVDKVCVLEDTQVNRCKRKGGKRDQSYLNPNGILVTLMITTMQILGSVDHKLEKLEVGDVVLPMWFKVCLLSITFFFFVS